MGIVTLTNIEKTYSNGKIEVKALKEINAEIEKGAFAVFAGPSGSGKTTLLNIIGAMDKPTGGIISIEGHKLNDFTLKEASNFRKERIGFVFQSYNLIPVLTAYENIELALELLGGYSQKEKEKTIDKIMEAAGISSLRDRKPSEISGGEQQRVAIARALVKEPAIILADEPTANLDSQTGSEIIKLMQELNTDLNMTFIFSSHDAQIIKSAKQVFNIRDGRLVV